LHIELEEEKTGSWNNHWRGTNRPTMRYDLFGITPKKGQWRWSRERSLQAINNYKQMLKELNKKEKDLTPDDIDNWYKRKIAKLNKDKIDLLRLSKNNKPEHYISPKTRQLGTDLWVDITASKSHTIRKLFGEKVFETPKSEDLIKRIIKLATDKDSVILDSFAGTGTTGQAVFESNYEDDGDRTFILIEMEDDIADKITAERIKRFIEQEKVDAGFEFCQLDKPLFDAKGQIDASCSFNQLATYIYFTETQTNLERKQISKNFIGSHNDVDYYLLYKEKGKNVLNKSFLKKIKKNANKIVIYADRCMIDEETLEKSNIQFKQIPYEVKVY